MKFKFFCPWKHKKKLPSHAIWQFACFFFSAAPTLQNSQELNIHFIDSCIQWSVIIPYQHLVWNSTRVRPLLLLVSACTAASISLLAQHGSYWKTLSQNAQFSSEHFFVSVITTLQIFNWTQSRPRYTLYTATQLGQQFSQVSL